jgi:predicted GNAT family acetyltransferase
VPAIVPPAGLVLAKSAVGVQMVATRALDDEAGPGGAWLALAQLTQPGPLFARTHAMGDFVGVRIGGRLAAVAGERLRVDGHTEVSGVCTHPDFRGRGLARRLSAVVAARIQQRGEVPFLHAWVTNEAAIARYRSQGFEHRAQVHVAVLARPA